MSQESVAKMLYSFYLFHKVFMRSNIYMSFSNCINFIQININTELIQCKFIHKLIKFMKTI